MAANLRASRGFTLVELMITLAVVVVLALAAMPSFLAMRQRAAVRGAAEETLSLWNQARFEAAKRNSLVKYGVKTAADGSYCIGLATTTAADDSTPCDCFDNDSSPGCDVAAFPTNQSEWADVTLAGTPSLGQDTGVAVMDSKRGALTEAADAGSVTLNGPPGNNAYQLNLVIDQFGRGILCETESATSKMSDYATRRCTPP